MEIIKRVLIAAILSGCTLCEVGALELKSDWDWSQENFELYSIKACKKLDCFLLVRKFHIPDDHEAESFSEKELSSFRKQRKTNPRYADPEVIFLDTKTKSSKIVGFGWQPALSSDEKSVAFAAQVKPISGYRVLAETMEGNEIVLYDLSQNSARVMARPKTGYLANPIFVEQDEQLLYTLNAAINGAYGGVIGISAVDIKTNKIAEILPPHKTTYDRLEFPIKIQDQEMINKKIDFYDILNPPILVNGRAVLLRMRPASSGYMYMAKEYSYDLVNLSQSNNSIYSWPNESAGRFSGLFAPWGDKILVKDKKWFEVDPDSGTIAQKDNVNIDSAEMISSSPNKEFVASVHERGNKLEVVRNDKEKAILEIEGFVREVIWSANSKSLIAIISRYKDKYREVFDRDEVVVFRLEN